MRKGRRRKSGGRIRRWLRLLLGIPLALWLGLNLFFATGWGTGLLAKVVESKVGVRSEFERVSWTPWSGVSIKGLKVLPPKDLSGFREILSVESIRVDPSWWSLAQGRKRFERLELSGVEGEVSLELLKAILARGQATKTPPPDPAPEEVKSEPPEADPVVVAQEEEQGSSSESPQDLPSSVGSVSQAEKAEVVLDDFKGSLVIKDASFKVYSEKFPELYVALEGIEGEIPLWGEETDGSLKIGELKLGESDSLGELDIPVALKKRVLRVKDVPMKVLGVDLELTAAIWMTRGLPCGVQVVLPSQSVDLSPVFRNGESPIRVGELKSSAQIKGYLLNPGAISGGSHTEIRNLQIRDQRDGSFRSYESGRAHLRFSRSGVQARELRLIGEEEAVLGNGFLTVAGEGAAVFRVVAAPTRADSLEKRIAQSVADLELIFAPLVTPDREYRDVRLEVQSGTLMVDLGAGGVWVPCFPALKSVMGAGGSRDLMVP